jgi:hypothetical protein
MTNNSQNSNQILYYSNIPPQPYLYYPFPVPLQLQTFLNQYYSFSSSPYPTTNEKSNSEIEQTRDTSIENEENNNDNIINYSIVKQQRKRFFKCDYSNCNKLYRTKENLILHYKNKHLLEKPFKCSYCDMAFSHRNGKTFHERRIHTFEFPYVCETVGCEMKFVSKAALIYHKKKCPKKGIHQIIINLN